MIFQQSGISDSWLIAPEPQEDDRGFFARTWDEKEMASRLLPTRISQSSVSFNAREGTLRGMHYQAQPHEESKYVRCTRGAIYDVILDLRVSSNTYRAWYAVTLSAVNLLTLFVPPGCAHGFLSLEDSSEVFYQMSGTYVPNASRGVRWDDPAFAVQWPSFPTVISQRDRTYQDYSE